MRKAKGGGLKKRQRVTAGVMPKQKIASKSKSKKPVKARIKQDANVLSCIPKTVFKEVDIFKTGCLLHFSSGNWGAKNPLDESEYGSLPTEIVRGWKYLMDRTPLKQIARIKIHGWRVIGELSLQFRTYKGMRYVPKPNIDGLWRRLKELENDYWARVDYFIDNEFDRLREDMKRDYPAFYDATAYPDKRSLRSKFHWDVDLLIAVPPSKNSGVLTVEQYQRQVAREQQRIKDFFNDALLAVSAKFLELTAKLRDKLVNKEAFRSSTLENLEEFIDGFSNLNITRNKELQQLVDTCKGYLSGVDAETLRDNELFARQVGKNMDKVVKEFGKLHDGELLRAIDLG